MFSGGHDSGLEGWSCGAQAPLLSGASALSMRVAELSWGGFRVGQGVFLPSCSVNLSYISFKPTAAFILCSGELFTAQTPRFGSCYRCICAAGSGGCWPELLCWLGASVPCDLEGVAMSSPRGTECLPAPAQFPIWRWNCPALVLRVQIL